jgi:hypothetical protein
MVCTVLLNKHYLLLTPQSRVLLEKLTVSRLVKKFPTFYGTRRFITVFTSATNCPYPGPDRSSLCPHIPIPEDPSQYYPPIYAWVSQVDPFRQVSPTILCIRLSSPPHALHAPPISFLSNHPNNIRWAVQIIKPTNITRVFQSRTVRSAGRVARKGETRNAAGLWCRNLHYEATLKTCADRTIILNWVSNTQTGRAWTEFVWFRYQCQALVNTVTNIRVSYNAWNVLTRSRTVSFSRWTTLHAVSSYDAQNILQT